MSLRDTYVRDVKENLRYLPTWLPQVPLAVGDVVRLGRGECSKYTTLGELGIDFRTEVGPAKSTFSYVSRGAVTLTTKAAGEILPTSTFAQADAGVHIAFQKAHATCMRLAGCEMRRIVGLVGVANGIIQAARTAPELTRHVVVTEVLVCERSTILVSEMSDSSAEITASGSYAVNSDPLLSLDASLELRRQQGIGLSVVGEEGLTPLFRAYRLRRSWLGRTVSFDPLQGDDSGDPEDRPLEDVADYDDPPNM